MTDVTFYIDVWGTYFRHILSPTWIASIEENCGVSFDRQVVCVNNIPQELHDDLETMLTERLREDSLENIPVYDKYYELMPKFNVGAACFKDSFYQSWADLCAIDDCKTKYMVFFSGDSLPWGRSDWVAEGIELLEQCPAIMSVNPLWNGFAEFEKARAYAENDDCYLGYNFSDQCYLIRTEDFNKPIYTETNSETDGIYPGKFGYSFERRVAAYMRNHRRFRASLKKHSYITRP